MKVTEAHWEIFIQFFEEYPDLVSGRISAINGKESYRKLWAELTNNLHSTGLGEKSTEKWQKTWSDFKCSLKKKAAEIKKSQVATEGGPGIDKKLTSIEKKMLNILSNSFYEGCGVKELGIQYLNVGEPSTSKTVVSNEKSQYLETNVYTKKRPLEKDIINIMQSPKEVQGVVDHDYLATPKLKKQKRDIDNMYEKTLLCLEKIQKTLDTRLSSIDVALKEISNNLSNRSETDEIGKAAAVIASAAVDIARSAASVLQHTSNNVQ